MISENDYIINQITIDLRERSLEITEETKILMERAMKMKEKLVIDEIKENITQILKEGPSTIDKFLDLINLSKKL